jgi:hypothetical protein
MSRVIAVRDSRTLVVQTNGRQSVITLKDVNIAPAEEAIAVEYLRRLIANAWVLTDNGDVYRSPDTLYVNGEMIRRAWHTAPGMRYLGQLDLGVRTKGQAVGNVTAAAPTLPPLDDRVTPAPRRVSTRAKRTAKN